MLLSAKIRLLAVSLLLAVSGLAEDDGSIRTWTDVNGRTVDAEFLWVDESGVVLRKRNSDKTYTVPLAKLSDADRRWLAQRRQPDDQAAPAQTTSDDRAETAPTAGLPALPEDPVEGVMAIVERFDVRIPWLVGIAIWAIGHLAAVWAARRDPLFVDVVRRHVRIPGHLGV